jgi:hypothetical protein
VKLESLIRESPKTYKRLLKGNPEG